MPDTTYRLDTMHSGLRMASLAAVVLGVLLGSFVIVPALARVLGVGETIPLLFSCIGGPAVGIGLGWAVERYLRSVWHSGRWLKVDGKAITLRERSGEVVEIGWAEPVDVLSWHFVIRGTRLWIPKGWYCTACLLAQGGRTITSYAFMKPIDAQAMPQWKAFPELISRKHDARQEHGYPAQRVDGQDQLWEAERDRWNSGAEMTPTDFAALVAEIDQRVAGWPVH